MCISTIPYKGWIVVMCSHSKFPSQYNVSDLEAYLTGKWMSKNAPKKLKYGNPNQRTTVRRRDLEG